MKITIIGGTGMVGSATVTEAAGRGHEVVSASRSGRHAEGAVQDVSLTLTDTQAVVDLVNSSDATVIAVSAGCGEPAQPVIDAHRALIAATPTGRLIVVGGAGSLLTPDGTRLVDTPGFPEEYKAEAQAFAEILDLYREAGSALTWTLLSPAPAFTDKPRTGSYVEGTDQPVGSEISVANFAVALVDEAEKDGHRGRRWTIANA
ncbi:NAD(P)-dependent oxidoreductase [Actinomyces sp. Marseille-P3109]|uniref:NAD(P)-dependent oxidoreductase n=1 Tax=Actinomyces sp. Marseille-P3109 TaxID=2083009 RepID=UPI000D54F689|nr:NAD(P)H-binding protein [Actinomyces sp. Marseille-P3109]